MKLIECMEGQVGKYAALSHCWGDPKDMERAKTTKENYHDRLHSIPYIDLPNSFRDATRITRELGLQYLWIDSLCIIQDDASDWQHESTKMTATYENAFITLAATASSGCKEGIRTSHKRARHFPNFSVRPAPNLGYLQQQPLFQRGWTLQEIILSPRVVHFADDELYLVCRSFTMSHDGHNLGPGTAVANLHSPPGRLSHNVWWNWVEDYSRRLLTYPQDKLPALAGLTQKFQQQTGATPAVGLWTDDLHYGLLWWPTTVTSRPQDVSFIPTWSWTSVDGAVKQLCRREEMEHGYMSNYLRPAKIVPTSTLTLSWDGEPLTSEISEGTLHIKGRLKSLPSGLQAPVKDDLKSLRARMPSNPDEILSHRDPQYIIENEDLRLHLFLDEKSKPIENSNSGDSVWWCLEMTTMIGTPRRNWFLILRHIGSTRAGMAQYQRLGVGYIGRNFKYKSCWFEGLQMQEVLLV